MAVHDSYSYLITMHQIGQYTLTYRLAFCYSDCYNGPWQQDYELILKLNMRVSHFEKLTNNK